jgi:hypothetical protein
MKRVVLGLVLLFAACGSPAPDTPDLGLRDMSAACAPRAGESCNTKSRPGECGHCATDDFLVCVADAGGAFGLCVYYTPDLGRVDGN